jgi:uncharacterized RDD family membrane protein YckC
MTQITINTTQNVNINFTAASLGTRILAILCDLIIQLSYLIAIYYVFFTLFGFGKVISGMDRVSVMAINTIFMLPVMFYTLLCESMMEGQTIGKRLVKIKVVKIDGYQAGFGDYLIRWLFRFIDVWLNSGLVGLISVIATRKSQRLGDLAAGTAVITLRNDISINSTILEELDQQYVPVYPLVIKLSDNDVRIIKETMEIAVKSREQAILDKLVRKIEEVTGIQNQSGNPHDFVRTVLKDYNYYTQRM